MKRTPTVLTALVLFFVACAPSANQSAAPAASSSSSQQSSAASPSASQPASRAPTGRVILVGQIVTMAEPGRAEAIAFEDGVVLAVGGRDEVMALQDDQTTVVELGTNVAYPGFVDAHAHWIGDRGVYLGDATPAAAMDAALSRGWTSISEQWVGPDQHIREMQDFAADPELPIRVDGYLAMNAPAPDGEHFGDWYAEYEPGALSDRVTIQGVKFTLDNGWGTQFHWTDEELTASVAKAHQAGWQVSIHTVSTKAHDMVLAAFEGALAGQPNELHHRIEHAIQVTDDQVTKLAALDLVTVVHLDGAASDWILEDDYLGNLGDDTALLARWRDFVDAGLHVAAATDTPWVYPDFALTDDIGRPVDQIAGGMDGKGRANPDTPEWVLDQLVTAEQALKAITVDAAWALGDEANRGHLAPGTYADITILSADVTTLSADEIRQVDVVATIVGGTAEYCADPSLCPSP